MRIEELEDKVRLLDYIKDISTEININNIKRCGQDRYWVNPCPVCGRNDHFTVYDNTNSYSSFSGCCKGGKLYKYLIEVEGLDPEEAKKKLMDITNNNITDPEKDYKVVKRKNINTYINPDFTDVVNKYYELQTNEDKGYFLNRGLSNDIIDKYKLLRMNLCDLAQQMGLEKYCNDKYASNYNIILPVWYKGRVVYTVNRAKEGFDTNIKTLNWRSCSTDEEGNTLPGIKMRLFNIEYIERKYDLGDNYIFVTEGIFDALSFETVGYKAIGLNGLTNIKQFINEIDKYSVTSRDITYIIALDSDDAGLKAIPELVNYFKIRGIDYKIFTPAKCEYKDPNAWLRYGERIFKESIKYCITGRPSSNKIIDLLSKACFEIGQPIQTGYNDLDILLSGGLYKCGLYVLGGPTGVGKTAFLTQMAENIVWHGNNVLYFSLEVNEAEIIARGISRLTYIMDKSNDKSGTWSNIDVIRSFHMYEPLKRSKDYRTIVLEQAIDQYYKYSFKLYVKGPKYKVSVKDIEKEILRHKEINKSNNEYSLVVMIDYLQILTPISNRASKETTEENITYLKRMAEKYNVAIIVVSALNRESTKFNTLGLGSFREASAIEYTADCAFMLSPTEKGNKAIEEINNMPANQERIIKPVETQLQILKNRNGRTGKCFMNFIGYANLFKN